MTNPPYKTIERHIGSYKITIYGKTGYNSGDIEGKTLKARCQYCSFIADARGIRFDYPELVPGYVKRELLRLDKEMDKENGEKYDD